MIAACNSCGAVDETAANNPAGYCADCLGEVEIDLANALDAGTITMAEYQAQFDAAHGAA